MPCQCGVELGEQAVDLFAATLQQVDALPQLACCDAQLDDRRLARDNTDAALAGAGIEWPPMREVIRGALAYMRGRGWFAS